MDPNAKQQIIDRLHEATNVLVTVSANPSVDQLAACIGFTLWLNKLGKHATAVFSGEVPSTIEFLRPQATLEKNTDSLRDFIISLDKSKADKLRYKVEDKVVKIFITPYQTSLSQADLQFSQGDFNVEVVMGLGVRERDDLDKAIIAHGRILHDATVVSVNTQNQGNIGSINWVDPTTSSLSEMMVSLGKGLSQEPLDSQIATALMTGIVAETERFSNDRTSPQTMQLASQLMSDGANQQLIVTHLEQPKPMASSQSPADKSPKPTDAKPKAGLTINHDEPKSGDKPKAPNPKADKSMVKSQPASGNPNKPNKRFGNTMVLDPPRLGGKLTANSDPEHMRLDPSIDPLGGSAGKGMILNRSTSPASSSPALTLPPLDTGSTKSTPPTAATKPANSSAPSKIDDVVKSAEPTATAPATDAARQAVDAAIAAAGSPTLEPIAAMGAQPVDLHKSAAKMADPVLKFEETPVKGPGGSPSTDPSTTLPAPQAAPAIAPTSALPTKDLPPPPPVPPPMMPPINAKAK